jgi:hypothetical protein
MSSSGHSTSARHLSPRALSRRVLGSARIYYSPIELEAEEEVAGAELFGCVRDGEAREAASFINKTKGRWLALRTLPVDKTRLDRVGLCALCALRWHLASVIDCRVERG